MPQDNVWYIFLLPLFAFVGNIGDNNTTFRYKSNFGLDLIAEVDGAKGYSSVLILSSNVVDSFGDNFFSTII